MTHHEKTWYQILGISFAVAIAALSIGISRVHADTLISTQSDASTYNSDTGNVNWNDHYTGVATVTPTYLTADVGNQSGSVYAFAAVFCWQDVPHSIPCDGWTNGLYAYPSDQVDITTVETHTFTWTATPPPGIPPGAYIQAYVAKVSGAMHYYGSSAGWLAGSLYGGAGGGGGPTVTQFISFNPADATIATTTFPLSATYWASSTPDLGYADLVPTYLQVQVHRVDNGFNLIYVATTTISTYGSTQTWTPTSTMDLPTGSYQADWTMYDQSGNYILITRNVRFAMNENPWPWLIGATSTNAADLSGLATSTCDYLHLQGCFQNALVWAFVPSQDSLQNLAQAGDQIMLAPPVGYVTQYRLAFASTSASGTPPWVVPLPTSSALYIQLVQPLRTGVAAVLIIILCFSMYRQIRTPLDL